MTDTLDKYHDELDEALARTLLDIEAKGRVAVWNLYGTPLWDLWAQRPLVIDPAPRSWQEQLKLWERYRDSMAVKHLFPTPHDQVDPRLLAYPGIAGQRIFGNEPWHFEFTAPKLPWWKRTGLYRLIKRYRLARTYGASKRKALGIKIWPRQSGKASR